MAKVDLRKVKDQATRAVEKKQYAKAAELYLQIAAEEPGDPDWRQRAGEALRKVPDAAGAIAQLTLAAEGYAEAGFLLKAIAVCKVILQLDPAHTATQGRLTDLYARRDGRPAGAPPPRAWQPPARTPAPTPSAPVAQPPSPVERIEMEVGRQPIAPGPTELPLDALPLHELLGGQKREALPTAAPEAAYEIELGDEELSFAEAVGATESPRPPAAAPPPPPTPRPPTPPPARGAPPTPAVSRPAPPPSAPAAPAASAPAAPAAARPRGPTSPFQMPFFSSLGPDDLRYVIERSFLREPDAGDVILRQGDAAVSLFVIVRGRVRVTTDGPPARELATLGEGAFFGELAILTESPRSATVTALEPTQLIEISRAVVTDIAARSPDLLKLLLRFFRDRLLDRFLGTAPLFAAFPPDEARALAERFVFLELPPGTRMIREGERAPGMFLLLSGSARVRRGEADLAQLHPGDVCGEMSLLERTPASATIETTVKSWVLELPRERFQEIMVTYPQILEYVSSVAEQRRQANLHVDFL